MIPASKIPASPGVLAGLRGLLEGARANLAEYQASGDERAIRAGRAMVEDLEKTIADLEKRA